MMAPDPAVKIGRWWWLLPASFAICLVVLAPAALLEWAASGVPNAKAKFIADSGSIWNGRGRILVTSDTAPVAVPFGWRFDALSLSGLRLGFFVDATSPALSGTAHVGLGFRNVELRQAAIEADARLLSMAHSAAALFAPAGKIRLLQTADERLRVRPASNDSEPWHVEGLMGLNADQFAIGGLSNAPPGNYALKLRGDGSIINIAILRSDGPPRGPLKLEGAGTLTLATPRRFTFSGFATAAADAPPALKQLGPTMADGRQRIELNTAW